jgi:hypothetical protein
MSSGIKHVAYSLAGQCPHFRLFEKPKFGPKGEHSGEGFIERGNRIHKSFLSELKEAFENRGFNCIASDEEMAKSEFAIYDDTLKIRGLPDAVCKKGDTILLFEFKSYPLAYAELGDLNQLIIYYLLLSKKFIGKNIIPILIYSEGENVEHYEYIKIGDGEYQVPPAKYLILKDINKEFVENALEIFMTSNKVEGYVISSKDCDRCGNTSCIVKTGGLYGRY